MTDTEGSVTATAPPGGSATAVSTQPVASLTVVEHGEASALPEIKWLWRRLFVFAATIFLCFHVWEATQRLDAEALARTVRNDQILIGLFALLYIAGGTTEAIALLVSAFRTTKKETVTTAPPPAPATAAHAVPWPPK